jgi:hypothetical protein
VAKTEEVAVPQWTQLSKKCPRSADSPLAATQDFGRFGYADARLSALSGSHHPQLPNCGRYDSVIANNSLRAIHRFDSASSVMACAVLFASPLGLAKAVLLCEVAARYWWPNFPDIRQGLSDLAKLDWIAHSPHG